MKASATKPSLEENDDGNDVRIRGGGSGNAGFVVRGAGPARVVDEVSVSVDAAGDGTAESGGADRERDADGGAGVREGDEVERR